MSVLSGEEKNEASVLIESLSVEEKAELVRLTGGDCNIMTPLLIREYLWRKKNRIALKGIADDIRDAEYRAFQSITDKGSPYPYGTMPISHGIPAAEATISSKEGKESSYDTDGSTISPIIAEYLMARAAGKRQDGAGYEMEKAAGNGKSPSATLEIPPSRHERIDLEEPHRMGEVLRNSLEGLSEMRIPAGKADPMAIMNANYEHDRAVLAKTDPMFARNLFHDVGHADGSGEPLSRKIQKTENEISNIMQTEIRGDII